MKLYKTASFFKNAGKMYLAPLIFLSFPLLDPYMNKTDRIIKPTKEERILKIPETTKEPQYKEAVPHKKEHLIFSEQINEMKKNMDRWVKEEKIIPITFSQKRKQTIEIEDWKIEIEKNTKSAPKIMIYNKKAETSKEQGKEFYTGFAEHIAKLNKKELMDCISAYAVQNPDKPAEKILVLASFDSVDFYILDSDKRIDWVPAPDLINIGLKNKPQILFDFGKDSGINYISAYIMEPNILKNLKKGKVFEAKIYPSIENDSEYSKSAPPKIYDLMPGRR